MQKVYRYGLPLAFAALLLVAWTDVLFLGARSQVQGFDNKAKEPAPEIQLEYLDPYPKKAEAWFNDNFPWRGLFQRFNGKLRSLTGARSPLPDKVAFGSDDWLYKGGLQMDIYRGKRRFTPEELRRVTEEIMARRDSVTALGGKYYLSVPPLKHHVYPQFLPDHVRPLNREYAVKQLYRALNDVGIKTIDLHEPLQRYAAVNPPISLDFDNLKTSDLYYRTDHHWTVRAGLIASHTILTSLRNDGIPVTVPDTTDYRFNSQIGKGLTLAQIAGIDRQNQDQFIIVRHDWQAERLARDELASPLKFPYPQAYVKHYQQRDEILRDSLPSLFVTRESFGENLIQPLSEHFGKAFYLFDEWDHNLNLEDYKREGGDIYLQLIWEGFIFNLLDTPAEDGKW